MVILKRFLHEQYIIYDELRNKETNAPPRRIHNAPEGTVIIAYS